MCDFCVSAITTEDLWVSSVFGLGLGSSVSSLNSYELCKHIAKELVISSNWHALVWLLRHDKDVNMAW